MSLFDRTLIATLPLMPKVIVQRFSARYIAGESDEDAMRVVRELNRETVMGTVDVLGEHTSAPEAARETLGIYKELLNAVDRQGLDCNISVKLSAVGLKIDTEFCMELMTELMEHAGRIGNFVRIDMEDSTCTSATLEIHRRLRERFDNVGVAIQAYLRRTDDDVDQLRELRANVRLCKGIYVEDRRIAYRDRTIIQRNFVHLLERLLEGGCYVGIATHDELLAWEAQRLVRALQLAPSQYEFQMLLGVDEMLRRTLVEAGHRMRVYVPYGRRWYEYSMRRLKENPKIAGYVLKNLLRAS